MRATRPADTCQKKSPLSVDFLCEIRSLSWNLAIYPPRKTLCGTTDHFLLLPNHEAFLLLSPLGPGAPVQRECARAWHRVWDLSAPVSASDLDVKRNKLLRRELDLRQR